MIDVSNLVKTPIMLRARPLKGMYIFLDDNGNLVCKNCTRCGLILDKSKFSPNGKDPNKVYSVCRECTRVTQRGQGQTKGGLKNKKRHVVFWKNSGIPVKCYVCSGPFEEIEHVRSRRLGGPNILKNTLPVCEQCNRGVNGKRDRPLCEWLRDERPEYLELVISKVLSFGVDPFTECEKVIIESGDEVSGRWTILETARKTKYIDVTDNIMAEAYRDQRERYS